MLRRRLRIRSLSSAAAFSVKVMAAMFSMAIPEPMRGHHPVDEGSGLARAGAGLDEEGAGQIGPDPVAGGLVDQLRRGAGHRLAPSGRSCP